MTLSKKKILSSIIAIVVILVITIVVILVITFVGNLGSSSNAKPIIIRSEKDIYNDIHHMANSMIIAVDGKIWGIETITPDKIAKLHSEIIASNYSDKQILLNILTRWDNDDFTQIVNDHNYVWIKLAGNVGYAIGIKEGAVLK